MVIILKKSKKISKGQIQVKTLNNSYRKGEYYYSKIGKKSVYIKKDSISRKDFKSYIEKRYIKQENTQLYTVKGKKKLIYQKDYSPSAENPKGVSRIYKEIDKKRKDYKSKYVLIADVDYRVSGMIKKSGTISVSSSSSGTFNDKMNDLVRNSYGAVASREGVATGEVHIGRPYNIHYSFIVQTHLASKVKKEIFA